jgi:hypothetical protein
MIFIQPGRDHVAGEGGHNHQLIEGKEEQERQKKNEQRELYSLQFRGPLCFNVFGRNQVHDRVAVQQVAMPKGVTKGISL